MTSRSDSLARPLAVFALLALVALGLVAGTGIAVMREFATAQALAESAPLPLERQLALCAAIWRGFDAAH